MATRRIMQETQAKAATKHTATPWQVHATDGGAVYVQPLDGSAWSVARLDLNIEDKGPQLLANAAYIVQACNNFEKLLASAKSALEFMEQVESDDWEEGGAETIPEVEAFRQVLAEIEATS